MSSTNDQASVASGGGKPTRRGSVNEAGPVRRGSVATGESKKDEVNVQVAVRCRPLNEEEKRNNHPTVVTCDSENKSIKVAYGPFTKKIIKSFTFDKVFGMYSRQEEVFEALVRPIVEETLAGFNCTIFAYGQTGTGKTHTMEGNINDKEEAGIVPRSVNTILEQLESSGAEFTIRVSFLELYNEELQDLLNAAGDKKLKLCEDVKRGVVCQNLEEIAVLNANDIFEILQRGIQQRQTAETLLNKASSRSHSIFTMKIMIKETNIEGEEVVRNGQLNLVDLAGSECIGRSGAKEDRAREAGSINQSLLTLGRVITALVDHHQHIPYRDSKLTRLLQESLGGKAKTCIIATLGPSQVNVEETISTLDYAFRARNIKNQPTVNQKLTKKVVMKEYFAEIETLRSQLMASREKNGVYLDPADFYAMESKIAAQESQLTECESALRARNEELKQLKQDNEQLTTNLERVTNELSVATQELTEAKSQLTVVKEELQVAFVELRATEEVVKEQAATEAELKKTIERLHGIIEEKQGEVSSLLSKVSVLEGKEEERLQQSQSFTTSILQQQSSLQQMISTLTKETDEQSASIEKGIEEMLKTGRKTCDVLKESIAAALKVLIEDTKVSKEFMKQSCETMTSDLMSSEKVYVGAIEGMAKEFSQYFQDNEDKMEGIQATLREQVEQMDRLTHQLEQSQEKMMGELRAYSKAENEACTAIQAQLKEWMAQFRGKSERHVSSANEMYGKNQAALSQKAKEIQDTMTSMLSEFMKMSDGMMSASLQETESFVKDSTAYSSKQSEDVSEKVKGLHERYVTANEQLTSLQQSSMSGFSSDMEVVGNSNKRTDESSAEVVQLVQAKKEVMASSMKDLGESYQAITKKTCHGVQSVMQCSEKILADVTNTTVKMNEQTSGEIEQFLTFLRGNGDELSQQINRHFSHTKSQYVVEDEVVLKSCEEIEQYGKEMKESKVVRSGRTPRKMHAFTAQPIRSTKSHNKIKSEARQAPSSSSSGALKDITYEMIRQEVLKYKQNAMKVEEVAGDGMIEVKEPLDAAVAR